MMDSEAVWLMGLIVPLLAGAGLAMSERSRHFEAAVCPAPVDVRWHRRQANARVTVVALPVRSFSTVFVGGK